ncbi:MAG: 2,3-bisphosphoglycerate-dependent phosphoglycerate mutase [Chromatiales bacterium]|nr:2,3-bisphosphoglycerate-dependent phosphoglycerate mutase [Chromatiales bacterium]
MKTIPERAEVVLIRHAQSEYNRDGRFTGWSDPPLTNAGVQEARDAGLALASSGYRFDSAYSSKLQRAGQTMEQILQVMDTTDIPRHTDWRLNERHYGALQGNLRAEAIALVGEPQVWRWRRGFQDMPPAVSSADPRHPINQPTYNHVPRDQLPAAENLADTRARVAAFWEQEIKTRIASGERLLIASHGNTLRALLMYLGDMDVATVESFEIPTGTPIIYRFDEHATPMSWSYLDPQQILRAPTAA